MFTMGRRSRQALEWGCVLRQGSVKMAHGVSTFLVLTAQIHKLKKGRFQGFATC